MPKSNLAKNTALLAIGNICSKGINFIMIPLFSSWLSAEDYGTFDLYCSYVLLLIPCLSLACSEGLFRLGVDAKDHHELAQYVTASFAIDLIGYIIACVAIIAVSVVAKWDMGFAFSLMLFGELGMNHFQGVLRATKKLPIYSVSNVVVTCVIAIATSVLVFILQYGLYGIAMGYAIGYCSGCLFAAVVSRYWRMIRIKSLSWSTAKELISYSFPLLPNNISWWFIDASDRILINLFLGPAANGIYAVARKIPNLCSSVFGVFSISWQEAASTMESDAEKGGYYNEVFNATMTVMASLCIVVLAFNYPLIAILFEERYMDAFIYIPILVTAVFANCIALFFGGIQISLMRPVENGVTTVVGAAINIVLNVALIPVLGLYGASIATLVANCSIAVARWYRLRKLYRFLPSRQCVCALILYCCFLASSYCCADLLMSSVNITCALVVFFVINRGFLIEAIRKVIRRAG